MKRYFICRLQDALACLQRYHQRYRQRRQLLALDRHALKDIGISRCDALREAQKPFWKE